MTRCITPIHQKVRCNQGSQHGWPHDATVQLAFHDFKALMTDGIFAHGMVNIQPWQVEQSREPANHCNNM